MSLNLQQSILATLTYFDIFEYPLTLFEIKKNLINLNVSGGGNPISKLEIVFPPFVNIEDVLNSEELKNKINRKNGFYFLKNREQNYLTRQKRYYIADKKFKRAKKIAWLLSKIPYIKMIAVCNSLGYSNADENSDIDFFIITAKNRIWTTRFLAVALIKLLNLRPKPGQVKDKICLSFFIDEENLNLEKFKITPQHHLSGGLPDVYLTYWTTQLAPIFDRCGMYEKFWQENRWVEKYLPNRISYKVSNRRKIIGSGKTRKLARKNAEFNWLEKLTKKIQLKMMNQKLKELMNKDTRVIVNDGVLKLFAVDRREEYLKLWRKKINF